MSTKDAPSLEKPEKESTPPADPNQAWNTGFRKRFPFIGLAALLLICLSVVAAIIIVAISDGDLISSWSVSTGVLLSIISSVTGICLAAALAEGATIAWWRKALHGATISELQNYWEFSGSPLQSALAGRRMNWVAFASIVTTLTAASGPLLQRASTVINRDIVNPVTISASVASMLPIGYTGVITDRSYVLSTYQDPFIQIMHEHTARTSIGLNTTGCNGACYTHIKGAGFAYNCTETTKPFNLDTANFYFPNGSINPDIRYGQTLFSTNMTRDPAGSMLLTVVYKATPECKGDLVVRRCFAKGAILLYPVVLQNNTISLQSEWNNDTVVSYTENGYETSRTSTFGGVVLATNDRFSSSAVVYFTGGAGWAMSAQGAAANENMDRSFGTYSNCSVTWRDPTNTILADIREIFLRTSVLASNKQNETQYVSAMELRSETIYESHYEYLAVGTVILLGAVGVIFMLYYGWWELGRAVSMSPIETAKAFGAPILDGVAGNAEANGLIKHAGDIEVKYGEVQFLNSTPLPADLDSQHSEVERRLLMSKPDLVLPPHPGMTY